MGLFLLDMVCALAVAGIDLMFPWLSRKCMQTYLPGEEYRVFFTVMGIIVVAYVLRSVLYFIITYWGHRMGAYMEADMRAELFRHIETLSFRFFDRHRTGQLMSRVTTDLFEITELAHHGPEDLLISAITIIGAFVILCGIEWRLAVIVFAVVPIFVVFTVILRRKMAAASIRVKEKMAGINTSIESGFSGIRTAKAFAMEQEEIRKFDRTNDLYVESKRGYYKAMAIFHGGMEFVLSIMSVLVILAGGYFIMKESMDYIDLVTFSLYIATFLTPIRKLVNFVEQYIAGMAGFKRFLEIMRTEPQVQDAPGAEELEHVKGHLEIKDVSFSYGDMSGTGHQMRGTKKTGAERNEAEKTGAGRSEAEKTGAGRSEAEKTGAGRSEAEKTGTGKTGASAAESTVESAAYGADGTIGPQVLRHVSLDIPAGTCFAVVGPSGGGKTTLCHLIPRFYDVTEGAIMIDGKDIRQVTQASLRRQIGIVQQDVFMFAGTIYENIAYGNPDAAYEDVIRAAVKAEIHDEIMQMPDGYQSYIGERGVLLSGGQKQRIGIARVFLKNPPVIILDEATSALDSITEIRIQHAFDELAKGRTSIIIAHRLSTIRGADQIAVIDHNTVIELGTHQELLSMDGVYARLVQTQSL